MHTRGAGILAVGVGIGYVLTPESYGRQSWDGFSEHGRVRGGGFTDYVRPGGQRSARVLYGRWALSQTASLYVDP